MEAARETTGFLAKAGRGSRKVRCLRYVAHRGPGAGYGVRPGADGRGGRGADAVARGNRLP